MIYDTRDEFSFPIVKFPFLMAIFLWNLFMECMPVFARAYRNNFKYWDRWV